MLSEGDVVTVGNLDLGFCDGTLLRQDEARARSVRLVVDDVRFQIDGNDLLDNVSLTAWPAR